MCSILWSQANRCLHLRKRRYSLCDRAIEEMGTDEPAAGPWNRIEDVHLKKRIIR